MRQPLTISKLDAARRQLETAIQLYFHQGEPVSIRTLVSAAYSIIRDINKIRGGKKMVIQELFFEYVKPEMHEEVRKLQRKAENFFKHANKDPDAILEFSPAESELLIWDACTKYRELTAEQPPLFQVFRGWFMFTHQNWFNLPEDTQRKLADVPQFTAEGGRIEFFNLMLLMVMKSGS